MAAGPPLAEGRLGCALYWHNGRATGEAVGGRSFNKLQRLVGKTFILGRLDGKRVKGGPVKYQFFSDRLIESSPAGTQTYKLRADESLGNCYEGMRGKYRWCLSAADIGGYGLGLVAAGTLRNCKFFALGKLEESSTDSAAVIAKKYVVTPIKGRFDFSNYNLSRDFDRVYIGRFFLLKNPSYEQYNDPTVARDRQGKLSLLYTIYHNGYSKLCEDKMTEPRTKKTSTFFTRTVIGGVPGAWEKGATYEFTIRNRYLATYNRAQANANSAMTIILRSSSLANDFNDIGTDVHRLLTTQGCLSTVVKQFEENLDRAYNDKPSLQEERQGFDRFPVFAHSCKKPDILDGRLRNPTKCRCVHDAVIAKYHPSQFEKLENNLTRESLVLAIVRKQGLAETVRRCLS